MDTPLVARRILIGTTAGALAFGLASCAVVPPGTATPTATAATSQPSVTSLETSAPTSAPATSASATPTVTTSAPTTSAPPSASTTKAKGKLVFYQGNLVSDLLAGSCALADAPSITLADDANDFFGTVKVKVVLAAGLATVTSVKVDLGQDSESIAHTLTAGEGAKGTSASLVRAGAQFTITGKGIMTDNGKVSNSSVPFTLTAYCVGAEG